MLSIKRYRVPPVIAAAGAIVIYGTVDVIAPIALSLVGRRHGWDTHSPGPVNLIGVLPLVAGAVVIVRAAGDHAKALRTIDWQLLKFDTDHLLTPDYLVVTGLYRYSRNPLYVGDILMWMGWTILLGSLPVAAGLVTLIVGLQLGVRLEERGLARRFGSQWQQYAKTTPRFLGRRADRP